MTKPKPRSKEKALTELQSLHAAVTRQTGRPPAGPFRSKSVPGWAYWPHTRQVTSDDPLEPRE